MKLRDLMSILNKSGFVIIRAQKHYVMSNGTQNLTIPRHTEINKFLAKKIIKQANCSHSNNQLHVA